MSSPEKPQMEDAKIGPKLEGKNVLRVWKFFFLFVLFVVFLLLLWKAIPVLLLLFAGTLVAIAFRFISDEITRFTRIPPLVSLTFVLVVVLVGGVATLVLTAPSLSEQIQNLATSLQESATRLQELVQESVIGPYVTEWANDMDMGNGSGLWSRVAGVFTTTFGAVTGFLLTLLIGVFLAYHPGLYVDGFLRLMPMSKRKRAREVIERLGDTLRWWMAGQLVSMVVLAVSTWVMLWLLDVPLAWILGILTGLLTFIPYLGPLIAMVPILLVALAQSPSTLLTVLILYLIIQNAEANVLMPIIFKKTVHLPPVLTIIAQVLLGAIFGLLGVVLATPLMAAGITITKMIYVEDVLGDSMDEQIDETVDKPMDEIT